MASPKRQVKSLSPEKVAYWYFRLNGFLQIENFVVHPARGGSQRTDADLLAVRFPYRAERLFDDPRDIMADDVQRLGLSNDLIDIVIVEVTSNQACKLNGPWTEPDKENVQRVLAAVGCFASDRIPIAAADIYRTGLHESGALRIRLVAVGRDRSDDLTREYPDTRDYPDVTQLLWAEMLAFIWDRFHRYRQQKTQVDQWDREGVQIKQLADQHHRSCQDFVERALSLMGVRFG